MDYVITYEMIFTTTSDNACKRKNNSHRLVFLINKRNQYPETE
jgi:hypothetical protein